MTLRNIPRRILGDPKGEWYGDIVCVDGEIVVEVSERFIEGEK